MILFNSASDFPCTYFKFSPFDYEREVVDVAETASVPNDKVGIVIKKFGQKLDDGQILADPARDQRGPLPIILRPGRYNEYANKFAYEIKQIDPVSIDPGYRGVVTLMASGVLAVRLSTTRLDYLMWFRKKQLTSVT